MSLNRHKPLYQPWNEDEFMSSPSVQSMKWLERLLYRSLLQKAFFCPTRPNLPGNDNQLWLLAGCENKQQWMEHKKAVLQNFTKIDKTLRGKNCQLSHPRLLLDWNREQERRQALAEKGHKGGVARALNCSASQAQAKLPFSTEPNRQNKLNLTEQTELNQTEPDKPNEADMSFKDAITDKARQNLNARIYPTDPAWSEMNSWKRIHGPGKVAEAFSDWTDSVAGEAIQHPLTEFLSVAGMLLDPRATKANSAKPLILRLAVLSDGDVTFNQKQSFEIARLLETYTEEQIVAAFLDFYPSLDDYSLKFAGKDFTEKAEQLIATLVARQKRSEELAQTMNTLQVEESQQAEKEREESAKKRAKAEALAKEEPW